MRRGALGLGVGEDAGESHGGAERIDGGDGGVEEGDGGDDDDDALDAVADGVGDGGELLEDHVGDLLVGVEAEGGDEGARGCGLEVDARGGEGVRGEFGAFHEAGDGQEQEEGHDGDDGEEVDVVEGAGFREHELLAHHVAGLRGDVGGHGGEEAGPVEGGLGEGGQRDAHDDGHERGCHGGVGRVAQEHGGQEHGETGLQGFHGVREGDRHLAQRHVGEQVAQSVHARQGQDELQLRGGDRGPLVQPRRPREQRQRAADGELRARDHHRVREHLEQLLVVDIEPYVERVPEAERRSQSQRLRQRRLLARRVLHSFRSHPDVHLLPVPAIAGRLSSCAADR